MITSQQSSADRAPDDRAPDDRTAGFTVVEVLVALAIMVIITLPTLMVLQSATNADVAHGAKIDASRTGAVAVERLSADIRSAEQIEILRTGELRLQLIDTNGVIVDVTWRRDNADLVRTAGGGRASSVVLSDLATDPGAVPFVAYDKNGAKILTVAVSCPGYVRVDLERIVADRREHATFDVASRNLNAGGSTC